MQRERDSSPLFFLESFLWKSQSQVPVLLSKAVFLQKIGTVPLKCFPHFPVSVGGGAKLLWAPGSKL